jgi:hypothetical protein
MAEPSYLKSQPFITLQIKKGWICKRSQIGKTVPKPYDRGNPAHAIRLLRHILIFGIKNALWRQGTTAYLILFAP